MIRIERLGRWLRAIVIACGVWLGATANAQIDIVIDRLTVQPVPIAIVPFGWQGAGAPPYDLTGVITSDLRNSGRFAPIPVANMPTRPTRSAQVNIQDWRLLRVDFLVIGQLAESGPDMYRTEFQVFNVTNGEQILALPVMSNREDLRKNGHRIADMIFEKLTGIPGVFNTRIAYLSEQRAADGSRLFKLIVSDADGENSRSVFESRQPVMSPAWSPDGRRLAYVSFEGGVSSVFVQTLSTGIRERVSARAGVNGAPSFSPDGRRLALTLSQDQGNLDVYALDLATQVLRQLTNGDAIDTEATWAPDGRSIYFSSDRAGGPQIYRVPSEPGGRPERITFEGIYNARPRVSPDGEKVALVYGQNNTYRIGIFDIDSKVLEVLTDGRLDESPSFAPNSAQIIYATRDNGRGMLASVSTDGRVRLRIPDAGGDVREPVWGPPSP